MMDQAVTIRRTLAATVLLVTLGMIAEPNSAAPGAEATPGATPLASPVAVSAGCDGLGSYFQNLADLALGNVGLAILRDVNFDVLALSEEEAADVAASLDALIPQIEEMDVPEPARAYHAAYLDIVEWRRALAADRDSLAHQRLMNDDRRLFPALGQAIQAGQAACGVDAWNDAWNAAFPPGD